MASIHIHVEVAITLLYCLDFFYLQSDLGSDQLLRVARYTEAIATAGPLPSLLTGIQERERQRTSLQQELAKLDALEAVSGLDERQLAQDLETHLREHWHDLLTKQITLTRQLLRKLLAGRLRLAPEAPDQYVFYGKRLLGAC